MIKDSLNITKILSANLLEIVKRLNQDTNHILKFSSVTSQALEILADKSFNDEYYFSFERKFKKNKDAEKVFTELQWLSKALVMHKELALEVSNESFNDHKIKITKAADLYKLLKDSLEEKRIQLAIKSNSTNQKFYDKVAKVIMSYNQTNGKNTFDHVLIKENVVKDILKICSEGYPTDFQDVVNILRNFNVTCLDIEVHIKAAIKRYENLLNIFNELGPRLEKVELFF